MVTLVKLNQFGVFDMPAKNWKEVMDKVQELHESHGIVQRGGKKYTQVVHRMEALREYHGISLGVSTEVLIDDGQRVVMKATVHTNDQPPIVLGTGHAEEIRGQGKVNETSALENCETSAIGRALACIGLSGGEFASSNEMEGVTRKEEAIASAPKAKPKPVASAPTDIRTGAEIAESYIKQINEKHSEPELMGWIQANQPALEAFSKSDPANNKVVEDAVKKRLSQIADSAGEGEVSSDGGASAPNDDPTPAPAPDPNVEDEIPF
jgi:hypothetical protein